MSVVSTVPLGEIMSRKLGSVDPSRFPDEIFDLYSIPAFDSGKPDVIAGRTIGSSKQIIQPGDVLLSKIVPHIRRTWVVGKNRGRRMIASGEWIVFRSDKIHPDYLRNVLVGNQFHAQFMQTVSGVGGSLLRARPLYVAEIEIPLPPVPEQKRIAEQLEQADRLRRARRYTLELSDTFLPAAFLELFGDPVRNEKNWETKTIDEVASKITDGEHLNPSFVQVGVPIVMAEQVEDFGVNLKSCKMVSPDDFAKFTKKCAPRLDDILVVSRGATIGRNCVINVDASFCMMASVILIKPNRDMICSQFLAAQLKASSFQIALRKTSGSSAQQAIYISQLRERKVVVPPLPMQQQFAALVERHEHLRATQREALRQAEHLFLTLLHNAFSKDV